MKKITRKSIVVAIIAGLLVLCDGIITRLLSGWATLKFGTKKG